MEIAGSKDGAANLWEQSVIAGPSTSCLAWSPHLSRLDVNTFGRASVSYISFIQVISAIEQWKPNKKKRMQPAGSSFLNDWPYDLRSALEDHPPLSVIAKDPPIYLAHWMVVAKGHLL